MRILILHSRYRSGGVSGENRVVGDEANLLRAAGHQVTTWEPSVAAGTAALARAGVEAVWSRRAARQVVRLVESSGAEVVHCHNLFPVLSPAVVEAAAGTGATAVMTLHSYRLLCLGGNLVRDGRVCEDCVGRAPWPGVIHRCYRDSAPGSAALATSLALHSTRGTFDAVRLFMAVSEFVRAKHIEAGYPGDRIVVKANFAWPAPRRDGVGSYFLYLGRLATEKGVAGLISGWDGLPAKLIVAGCGPEEARLRSIAHPGVEFVGLVPPDRLPALLSGARAVVVPSLWYEGQPRSILEAYAVGVPVLASRVGGLPEVVADGETGLLVERGDREAWRAAVMRLLDDDEALRLGQGAYEMWQDRYTPTRALGHLEACYGQALSADTDRPRRMRHVNSW